MRAAGRLEAVDTLLIRLVEQVADRADDVSHPDLARQYCRQLIGLEQRLRSLAEVSDDSFAALIAAASGIDPGR
jgi:hypothetical protein